MAIRPWTPEQLRDPRDLYASGLAELRGAAEPPTGPALKNQEAVRGLSEPGTFTFRGRRYFVPPLPYLAGLELQDLAVASEALDRAPAGPETTAEVRRILNACARLFYAHSRPVSPVGRALRLVLPNPFRRMTETEAGRLFGFFTACRMRSSVRAQ